MWLRSQVSSMVPQKIDRPTYTLFSIVDISISSLNKAAGQSNQIHSIKLDAVAGNSYLIVQMASGNCQW